MSGADENTLTSNIVSCANCEIQLPLRAAEEGEDARDWICSGCQHPQSGLLDIELAANLTKNVRPTAIPFDQTKRSDSIDALQKFAQNLSADEKKTIEKRAAPRYSFNAPALAVQVDDQFRPVGETVRLVTRDISTSGILLVHSESLQESFLAIELERPKLGRLQVAMDVVRSRPIGDFFEIAGRFLTKFA